MRFDNMLGVPGTTLQPNVWYKNLPFTVGAFGTVSSFTTLAKRRGDELYVVGSCVGGTVASSAGTVSLPPYLRIDLTKVLPNQSAGILSHICGIFAYPTSSATPATLFSARTGYIAIDNTDSSKVYMCHAQQSTGLLDESLSGFVNSNDGFQFSFTVPIEGWGPTI